MHSLFHFVDHHTGQTGAIGVASGGLSWLLAALHGIAGVAADVGIILCCGCSCLTFLLLLRKWRRSYAARRSFNDREFDRDPLP